MKRTIKLIVLFAAMVVLAAVMFGFESSALSFQYMETSDGTVAIRGYSGETTTLTIPEEIDGKTVTTISDKAFYEDELTSVTIPDTVVYIGESAFRLCENLKEVRIGAGVKSVGKYAFSYCDSIEKVYAKDISSWASINFASASSNPLCSKADFYIDNKPVTNIVIPQGVTSIGNYAFSNCTTFTAVTIPDSVTSIGDYAFCDCDGFGSIVIPDSVTYMGEGAFDSCSALKNVKIGNGVTVVDESAFSFCTDLRNVVIGNSVTKISGFAFGVCPSLKRIIIPDSVTEIASNSFDFDFDGEPVICCNRNSYAAYYFSHYDVVNIVFLDGGDDENVLSGKVSKLRWSLDKRTGVLKITGSGSMFDFSEDSSPWDEYEVYITSVELPEGLTNISSYAFAHFSGITSVTIPGNVNSIDEGAFYGCELLESIVISDGVTTIGESAFSDCVMLNSVTLPKSITTINSYAFAGCEKLTEFKIPDKLTSIKEGLFFDCYGLKNVTIPDGVTAIGDSAFRACSSLKDIKIPDSVKEIGRLAFFECDSLEDVHLGKGVTTIYVGSFERCSKLSNVIMGDNVDYIGMEAFKDCNNLKSIVIGSSVGYIGKYAFEGCYNLESFIFNINDKNQSKISDVPDLQNTNIKQLILPASIKNIGYEVLPEKLEEITIYNPKCYIDEENSLDYSSTIYGFKGSTAEAFAEEIGAEFIDVETVHTHSYKTVEDVKATCKAEGRLLKRCTCGKEELTVRKKLAHTYTSKTTKAATCVATGTKVYTCICGYSYTETLAKKAHSYSSSYTVDKNATCSAAGSKSRHCTTKGCTSKTSVTVIGKKSHTNKTTTTKATLSKNGKTVTKCSACGNVSKTVTVYYPKTIKLSATSYTYTGKTQKPSVTVKDSKGNSLVNNTDYTVAYASGRKNAGKFAVAVNFKGKYTGTKKLYFTIVPKGTGIKSVIAKGAGFTVKWSKQTKQTTGYQIQYSLYSSFKKAETVTLTKNTLTSRTISGLDNSTKYYVRIRTYKTVSGEKFYSAWSSAKSVKTKNDVRIQISSSATVYVGGTKTLSARTYPEKVTVKWKSSNTSVAKVSSKGKITAVKKGSAVVTAYFSYKGKTYKGTCKLTVKVPSLFLSKTSVKLSQGNSVKISATAMPSGVTVKWKSSNTTVAKVSKGKITALKAGRANISASFVYGGKTYSEVCKVTIVKDPAKNYVDIAARTFILLKHLVKNPSTLKVNNIYVGEADHVVIWYSAANSYGGITDGWVCAYFEKEDSEVYKLPGCYQIKVDGGYLEVLTGYPRLSTWIDTLDINDVYKKVKEIGEISYR